MTHQNSNQNKDSYSRGRNESSDYHENDDSSKMRRSEAGRRGAVERHNKSKPEESRITKEAVATKEMGGKGEKESSRRNKDKENRE